MAWEKSSAPSRGGRALFFVVAWRMGKDDWKYDEDAFDEMEAEEKKATPPPEKQCAQCLHWVDREAIYCPWCGKAIGEVDRKR